MKFFKKFIPLLPGLLAIGYATAVWADWQIIPVSEIKKAPQLDGDGADWANIKANKVALHNSKEDSKLEIHSVDIKAAIHGDSVYFYAKWADPTHDTIHKPFVWDEEAGKYRHGPQREDRFSLQFLIQGEYDTNWLSGKEFRADTWHWKSSRTNPNGKADDKMTIVSLGKLLRAYKGVTGKGDPVYILRSWDEGDKNYTTTRYREKQEDIMPKYLLNKPGSGSSMDVDAKGVWRNGYWTLELRRKLNTGHEDDLQFVRGQEFTGGIAVFNRSQNDDHAISSVLRFRFD